MWGTLSVDVLSLFLGMTVGVALGVIGSVISASTGNRYVGKR